MFAASSCFDPWRTATVSCEVMVASRGTPASLAALQARRLAETVAHAARHSPLYRSMLQAQGLVPHASLSRLPVMRKRELMPRFDEWVTDPALRLDELRRFIADPRRIGQPFAGRYTVWESSGSSGEPGVFVQDAAALAVYDALEALRRPSLRPPQRWIDPWMTSERLAFVGATTGHFASTVSVERLRRLNPFMAAAVHSLSFLQPTAGLVAQLNALAPSVLATYPTAAVLLAEEAAAGRLRIALREIWTGGETLTPAMRRFVQQRFGCPVSNSYGASEFLAIAAECGRGHLHLNSDWVILESVDEQGRAVPDGQPGDTTLLTNLANRVQPLIRYDIGDRITFARERCECGSPLPVFEVQGRVDDALVLQDEGRHAVRLLPLALTTVLEDEAGVFDFLLTQRGPHALRLRIGRCDCASAHADERAREALNGFLVRQGLRGVRLDCRYGVTGTRGRSGKVQRVVAC